MPVVTFILRLCCTRNFIIVALEACDIREKTKSGKPIPIPKNMNVIKLLTKSIEITLLAKSAAMNNGLQGTTIAPKKKPYTKAPINGFLTVGVSILGKNLPTSISKISNKLIIISIPKAIGETIPITWVKEISRSVVNIKPSININRTTPNVIITPNKASVFLSDSLPESWFAR